MSEREERILYQEHEYYRADLPDEPPYLIGSRCRGCGFTTFPPRVSCPSCMSRASMEQVSLGSTGTIDTFSILHVGAPGFAAPYAIAYVIMPAGVRVLSLLTGCEPSEEALEIGARVELVIEKIREDEEGNEVRGFKFRPVAAERSSASPS